MAFDSRQFGRKHGVKLATTFFAPDGAKVVIPGIMAKATPAELRKLANNVAEKTPLKVQLAVELEVNGQPVKDSFQVLSKETATVYMNGAVGTGEDKAPEPVNRVEAALATNGQK